MEPRSTVGKEAKELRENAHELLEEARRQEAERQARKAKRKEGAKLLKEGIFGTKPKKDKEAKKEKNMEPELIINTGGQPYEFQSVEKKPSLFSRCMPCCQPTEEDDLEEDRRRLLDV